LEQRRKWSALLTVETYPLGCWLHHDLGGPRVVGTSFSWGQPPITQAAERPFQKNCKIVIGSGHAPSGA